VTRRRIEKSTQVSFLSILDKKQLNVGTSVIKRPPKPEATVRHGNLATHTVTPVKPCCPFLSLPKMKFHFCDHLQISVYVATHQKG
jgi:hypothetical protein